MTKPYFFISHKHADADIARALADFVRDVGQANVDIHLSSASEFEGPRVAREVNDELRQALARTQVLFLVYTDERHDWSYCMWECGVATDPNDTTRTNVVVIQCGAEAPVVYGSTLRVDATSPESVEAFVSQLCTSSSFIPQRDEPLTGYDVREQRLKELAQRLYSDLEGPIQRHRREIAEQVTSPFVKIELAGAIVDEIRDADPTEREERAMRALLEQARIESSQRADGLFNVAIGPETPFSRLAGHEVRAGSASMPPWLQSVVRQVVAAIRQEFLPVAWAPFEADGGRLHLPFVSSYSVPGDGASCSFNIAFMRVRSPAILAGDRMITMENVVCIRLADVDVTALRLSEVLTGNKTRIPILSPEGRAHMIAHRSMIVEFIAARSFAGADTSSLTLSDLLDDDEMAQMFSSTFGTVGPDATLDDARAAMSQVPGCQDVFVTTDGTRDSEVIGWLTNTMFVQT